MGSSKDTANLFIMKIELLKSVWVTYSRQKWPVPLPLKLAKNKEKHYSTFFGWFGWIPKNRIGVPILPLMHNWFLQKLKLNSFSEWKAATKRACERWWNNSKQYFHRHKFPLHYFSIFSALCVCSAAWLFSLWTTFRPWTLVSITEPTGRCHHHQHHAWGRAT